VPTGARQSPQDEVRNALLAPGIPAYPRLERKRQDRPVTPEVAGSSPVAPVKTPANRPLLLPDLAQSTAGLPIVPALIPQANSRFDSGPTKRWKSAHFC
jgi:hypothetical protein